MKLESKDSICPAYRMYIEGVYDVLRVQESEDLTGEIAELIDDVLYDLYRTGAADALTEE